MYFNLILFLFGFSAVKFLWIFFLIVVIDDYNEEEEETEEEYEGEEVNDVQNEEKSEELACPFCLEDFDVLGLCCHIDADHRMEVKPRVIQLALHFCYLSTFWLNIFHDEEINL